MASRIIAGLLSSNICPSIDNCVIESVRLADMLVKLTKIRKADIVNGFLTGDVQLRDLTRDFDGYPLYAESTCIACGIGIIQYKMRNAAGICNKCGQEFYIVDGDYPIVTIQCETEETHHE